MDSAIESVASEDDVLILRKRRHKTANPLEGLNLTAMMDMMTIILVFLIKQYASAPENIPLNDDLRPPPSTAPENLTPSTRVIISKSTVMVQDDVVLKVSGADVAAAAGTDQPWAAMQAALDQRVSVIEAVAARGGAPFDGNLMVVADEDTPYTIVANVLYAAGKSRFTTYRLVVRRK